MIFARLHRPRNSFVWYDHGTALRANNLIYYALVARESGNLSSEMEKLLDELLEEHAEFWQMIKTIPKIITMEFFKINR